MNNQATDLTHLIPPPIVKMLDERNDLAIDLYRLALKLHAPSGLPCDPDIECHDCTLLLIAAEELCQSEPFMNDAGTRI